MNRPMPIGVEDFEKIHSEGYYYVDKTLMIKEILDKKADVNLFTRPRRFGKTLALSMLKYYFEDAYDWNGNHIWNIGDIVGDVKMAFDVGSLTTRASVQMQGTLSTVNDCSFDLFYCYAGPYRYLIDPARGKILEKKSGKW